MADKRIVSHIPKFGDAVVSHWRCIISVRDAHPRIHIHISKLQDMWHMSSLFVSVFVISFFHWHWKRSSWFLCLIMSVSIVINNTDLFYSICISKHFCLPQRYPSRLKRCRAAMNRYKNLLLFLGNNSRRWSSCSCSSWIYRSIY
jgi:hypothetical protein